jgi:thioredoxin 1
MSTMAAATAENYDAEVLQSGLPVVVDVWGPRCSPCLALMPQVATLADEYEGRVRFVKLNIMENRRLAIELEVMGVPTILFYAKGGEEKGRLTGDQATLAGIRASVEGLL